MSDADRTRAWDAAGRAAARLVEDGMLVGLGTGRAAAAGIRALGRRMAEEGLRCTGVPTSGASARLATDLGIPVTGLRDPIGVAFDGADAIDAGGLTVKGAGGAMVRERAVAAAAARFVVLVDAPKLVDSLDRWGRLPLAVVPFAASRVARELADLAPQPREGLSDDGLTLIDLRPPEGADWQEVAVRARSLPGVVDHGLFTLHRADVLVGRPDGGCDPAG